MSTRTSLIITEHTPRPNAGVSTYTTRSPIGYVSLDDGAVDVSAVDPARLLLIAEAFTDAARQLSQQLDVDAARATNAAAEQTPVPA